MDDPGFRAQCYGNMMLLLTQAAGVGRSVWGGLQLDDLHCVARLFVVAARRAGRVVWDTALSHMLRTLFDMEEVLYGGEVGSGDGPDVESVGSDGGV